MSEYIVNLDGELGMALAVACAGAGFVSKEIVRCRDCKWCMAYSNATYCDRFASSLPTVEPDDFCAWAVRRTEAESG